MADTQPAAPLSEEEFARFSAWFLPGPNDTCSANMVLRLLATIAAKGAEVAALTIEANSHALAHKECVGLKIERDALKAEVEKLDKQVKELVDELHRDHTL